MCTICFIATSQLFSAVSWSHMCICVCIYTCMHVYRCVYVQADAVCVCSRQGMKQKVGNWTGEGTLGLPYHSWLCIHSKNSFHRWTYFSPCIRNKPGPHLAPECWNTPLWNHVFIAALPYSPWPRAFLKISNNQLEGGNIKWHTAHWAGSCFKVRERGVSDLKVASVNLRTG